MIRWNCPTNLAQEQPRISCTMVFRTGRRQCLQQLYIVFCLPNMLGNSVWEQVSRVLWLVNTTWRIQISPGNSLETVMRNIKPLEQQVVNFVQEQAWEQFLNISLRISHTGCLQQTPEQSWDQLHKVFATAILRSVKKGVCNSSLEISFARCSQQ